MEKRAAINQFDFRDIKSLIPAKRNNLITLYDQVPLDFTGDEVAEECANLTANVLSELPTLDFVKDHFEKNYPQNKGEITQEMVDDGICQALVILLTCLTSEDSNMFADKLKQKYDLEINVKDLHFELRKMFFARQNL